ncbi:MAG: hypothetical protein C4323_07110 [Mastigocladus sp. ERB_26_2]
MYQTRCLKRLVQPPTTLRVRQSPYPDGKPLRVYVTETAFLGGWRTNNQQSTINNQQSTTNN